jgi:hypothetical protein
MILDQVISYCTGDFGSGCWLLFLLFWIKMLATVPIILDQAVGYCSQSKQQPDSKSLQQTPTNSLIKDHRNSNQQPDAK